VKAQLAADSRAACTTLLSSLGMAEGTVQIGATKVFFRKAAFDDLETRRQKALRLSAVVMQASVRRWLAVRRYTRIRALVIKLQSLVRGHRARLLAHTIRRNNAATLLQAFARRCVARTRYTRFLHAVVRMQSWRRGAAARRVYLSIRRQRAAVLWQAAWARHLDRRRYLGMRAAAVRLQCWERQRRAKALLARYRREAREVGNLKASNIELRAQNKELAEEVATLRSQLEVALSAGDARPAAAALQEGIATAQASLLAAQGALQSERLDHAAEVAHLQQQVAEWRSAVLVLSRGSLSSLPIDAGALHALVTPGDAVDVAARVTPPAPRQVSSDAATASIPPLIATGPSPLAADSAHPAGAAPAISARSGSSDDSGAGAAGAYSDFTVDDGVGVGTGTVPAPPPLPPPAETRQQRPRVESTGAFSDGAAAALASQATEMALLKARLAEADRQMDAVMKE